MSASYKNQNTNQASVKCHGKMILIGEHAVVYGAKAVAMPVYGKNLRLKITEAAKDQIIIGGVELTYKLQALLEETRAMLDLEPTDFFSVSGESTLPLGAGLGSSAALAVGLLKGVTKLKGISLTTDELSQKANRLEKIFHGSPSGLDVAVVAHDSPIVFEKSGETTILKKLEYKKSSFNFVLIDSKSRASTKEMITIASKYFQLEADRKALVAKFDSATEQLIAGINEGMLEPVKTAMNKACELLSSILVVPEELNSMIKNALVDGCMAAKPTGAGGGGCILGLLPNNKEQSDKTLANLIKRFGENNVFGVTL